MVCNICILTPSSYSVKKNTVGCSDLWPDSIRSQRKQWRWRGQSGLGSWPHWCAPSNPRSWFENQQFQFQKWDHQGGTVRRWELQRAEENITAWDRTAIIQDANQMGGHKGSYRSQHFHQWLWWGLYQSGCQKMPSTAENRKEMKERLVWWCTEWVERSFTTKCYSQHYFSSCGHTHLILRGAEQVVSSSMQGQSSYTCLVGTHHLDTVAPSDGPHTDGAVGRGREDHRLEG